MNFLNNKLNKVVVLGPSMCMIPKINNIYNMQIIIKYKSLKEIYNALEYLNNYYKEKQNISFEIDINPLRIKRFGRTVLIFLANPTPPDIAP